MTCLHDHSAEAVNNTGAQRARERQRQSLVKPNFLCILYLIAAVLYSLFCRKGVFIS